MKIETQRFIDRYVGSLICRIFSMYYRLVRKEPATMETQKILIILLSEPGPGPSYVSTPEGKISPGRAACNAF